MEELALLKYLVVFVCVAVTALIVLCIILLKRQDEKRTAQRVEMIREDMFQQQQMLRLELSETTQRTVKVMGELLGEKQDQTRKGVADMAGQMDMRLNHFALENELKLENIRSTMEKRLTYIQEDNNKKLDEMRHIVDEKLQKTINDRMTQSFALVNERLEQVYKGLGEMQTLAVGVGDLKKVLSGVKTRGILGEIQLGAILAEILAPEQYETNVMIDKGGKRPVEYAVKLPGDGDTRVYLPIDSKFPLDAYSDLLDAYDAGAPEGVRMAQSTLRSRVREAAKDIRDKYIDPPATTDFAILFLPTEGLYAEVVRMGMLERLQREFRVSIAGPSTMAAILNSLQMGFRSLAIQQRSGEVWKILSAVKTEFDKFQTTLQKTQERLTRANNDLDELIGVRTRQIRRSLKEVTAMPPTEAAAYLPEVVPPENAGEED